jgi:hypothetical protein
MTRVRRIEAHAGTIPSAILLAFCSLNVGRRFVPVNQRNADSRVGERPTGMAKPPASGSQERIPFGTPDPEAA